jgi:hypothetical protein
MKKIVGALLLASILPLAACTTTVAVRPPAVGMVFVEGRWIYPPYARAIWVSGYWRHTGWYGRAWVPGHWAR